MKLQSKNTTIIVFIYQYMAAKTSVLQYVFRWPYVLSGCLFGNDLSQSMPPGTCVFFLVEAGVQMLC